MTSNLNMFASWRDDTDEDQLFDEDLQVILRRSLKKQPPSAANDTDPGKGSAEVLDGWTNPLVYHRAAKGSSSLSILVDRLQRSRTIACEAGAGCGNAEDLDLSMQQAANAWAEFVLPLERMNCSQSTQSDSAPMNEEEKIARQAVNTRLLGLASAKETCLKYVKIIFVESQGKQRYNVVRGADLRFEKSLAQIIEFAKLVEVADKSLISSINLVVARMIGEFARGR